MLKPKIMSWLAAAAFLGGCTTSTAPVAPATAPVAPATATTKEEAAAAMQRQDYVTAERLYRSLAEKGDASAQHFLGKMYENGEGVRQNSAEAAKWFRLAADQGHTGAQFYLGGMYANGNGVPRDYVQAYMWLDLSSAGQQNFYATASRSAVADKMTPAQIVEAQRLVSVWKAKRPDQS
jgi:Sel1 repeat